MRSLLPLSAGGAGLWHALPHWIKIHSELYGSEAFNAAAIFGGQDEQGAAQAPEGENPAHGISARVGQKG
jgi:hypothetical protein